jgi:hypothetical protein
MLKAVKNYHINHTSIHSWRRSLAFCSGALYVYVYVCVYIYIYIYIYLNSNSPVYSQSYGTNHRLLIHHGYIQSQSEPYLTRSLWKAATSVKWKPSFTVYKEFFSRIVLHFDVSKTDRCVSSGEVTQLELRVKRHLDRPQKTVCRHNKLKLHLKVYRLCHWNDMCHMEQRPGRLRGQGSKTAKDKRFFSTPKCPDRQRGTPGLLSNGHRVLFLKESSC